MRPSSPRAVARILSCFSNTLKACFRVSDFDLNLEGSRLLMKAVGLSGNPLDVGIWERHLTFFAGQCNGLEQSN